MSIPKADEDHINDVAQAEHKLAQDHLQPDLTTI
jgi:hypothetical protein